MMVNISNYHSQDVWLYQFTWGIKLLDTFGGDTEYPIDQNILLIIGERLVHNINEGLQNCWFKQHKGHRGNYVQIFHF